ISTRDGVIFGFGLEQLDSATRNEVVKRSMSYLLPTTPDTTPPTIVGFKYPEDNYQATPADPVELEVTAFDERGDMSKVNLLANGVQVGSVPVYPFQFRYLPPASAVGTTVTPTAQAIDKAGNMSTSDLHVRVVAATANVQAPVPVAPPTMLGTPTVGSTLSCITGGFLNTPTSTSIAWLRNGVAISGANTNTY